MIIVVLRNIYRNLRRLFPMIVIIVTVFAVMIAGNAVLQAANDAFYRAYREYVVADMSVSYAGDTNFTVFGSDQLLVGEYVIAPVIPNFDALAATVKEQGEVDTVTGLVTALANVDIDGSQKNTSLFGVDFSSYRRVFPEVELRGGAFPAPGEPGIVIQDSWSRDNRPATALIGTTALIRSGTGRTFTLREVPVTGVFSYPGSDALLETVALIDADTARAINGYVYGATGDVELSDDEAGVFEQEFDDLFGAAPTEDSVAGSSDDEATESGVDIDSLFGSDVAQEPAEARARESVAGAWNFLLVRLNDPAGYGSVARAITDSGFDRDAGYLVRRWYTTVGGNAVLVRALQVLFNAGLVFVGIGAAIISTNALVLSLLERRREIGTMRALGASRPRIASMVLGETVIVVIGAGLVGIAGGVLAIHFVNAADYTVSNQYIRLLFGGRALFGVIDLSLVVEHIGIAVLLAVVSVVYPVKRALDVTPREAMVE